MFNFKLQMKCNTFEKSTEQENSIQSINSRNVPRARDMQNSDVLCCRTLTSVVASLVDVNMSANCDKTSPRHSLPSDLYFNLCPVIKPCAGCIILLSAWLLVSKYRCAVAKDWYGSLLCQSWLLWSIHWFIMRESKHWTIIKFCISKYYNGYNLVFLFFFLRN